MREADHHWCIHGMTSITLVQRMVLLELCSCCFRLAQTDSLHDWCKYVATTYSIFRAEIFKLQLRMVTYYTLRHLTCIVPTEHVQSQMDKGYDSSDKAHRGKGKVETKNNRTCVLKASTVEYQLIPSINTLDPPSINTRLILDQHSINTSVHIWSTPWLTLHWHFIDILVDS